MKKILSAFIVLTMVLTVFSNLVYSSDNITASDILLKYNITELIRSDDFTSQTSLDTSFWNVTGAASGISDGTLKIAKNCTLSQAAPVYREDYAVDIKFTFPKFTSGTPDYNGPKFRLIDSNSKEYYGFMQWNNYKYYNNPTSNTSVAPDLFKTTYAANVKIDDRTGTGTTKERIYIESVDYRLLIIVSNGKIHTYLLDPTIGEQLLKFNDYDMTDTNIGSSTAFSLSNALGYAMDIDSISMYTVPDTSFTMTMSTPKYIASDDSISFDMDKAAAISSANGLTVKDSQGNEVNGVTVSSDNTKLILNFNKNPYEKYTINVQKGVFGDGTYSAKNNYEFIVYTLNEPQLNEDFADTSVHSALSIPANSSVADGVLKMGQSTQI